MTVSFHKYGDYFPGTGALADTGYQKGKHYTVNVPLREGMDDESYRSLYEPIMQKVIRTTDALCSTRGRHQPTPQHQASARALFMPHAAPLCNGI